MAIVLRRHVTFFKALKREYVFQLERNKAIAVDTRPEILKDWFQIVKRKCTAKGFLSPFINLIPLQKTFKSLESILLLQWNERKEEFH